jgi:hypothetical protein
VFPVFPVFPVAPVLPVAPVSPFFVSPVAPVAPAGPAGPGTATTVGDDGETTTGLSHALNPSAASSAADSIEYLMTIPRVWLTKKTELRTDRISLCNRVCGIRLVSAKYAACAACSVRCRA